jgi:putative tryptophan/tyrosine transport system substrate-binding protein
MRRRDLMTLLGGAAIALPVAARVAAQVARAEGAGPVVIGLLSPFTRADTEEWHQAFRQGLRDLGWVEGANLRMEYRYADGLSERLPDLAADLVNLKVAVIVVTVTPDALAAAKATKTIPIVMASTGDPVATGLVTRLARPGGNITGLTQISTDLAGKRLELLKEVAPGTARVAVLWNPEDAISVLSWREIQRPARQLGMELHSLEVRSSGQFDPAFTSAIGANDGAITALPAPIFVDNRKRIADFAAANRLASVFHLPEFVHDGGLLSYGPDRADLFRRAATYVDKILKGANPGDLAVEQPIKFQLVINFKTAKALGLEIPPSVLTRADEVIE